MAFDPLKISRDLALCAPAFRVRFEKALAECRGIGYQLATFEAWRSPERQAQLYEQGRSREGKIVTKAKPWESWHQFGAASDVALFQNGTWSWNFPVEKVAPIFVRHGLEDLRPFEGGHFQLTGGLSVAEALKITRQSGLQALWQTIEMKTGLSPSV